MTQVYRIKSDNFDGWCSFQGYQYLIMTMSTGDYHTHKARKFEVDSNTLDKIMWHSSIRNANGSVRRQSGFLDITTDDETGETLEVYYDGFGDCFLEPVA